MNPSPTPEPVATVPAANVTMNPFYPRKPLWTRVLASLATIGLTLSLIVITSLAILGWFPTVRAALENTSDGPGRSAVVALAIGLLAGFVLPIIAVRIAARKKWINWKTLAFAWLAVLPVLFWLTWDDVSIRQPLTIEELSPPFPGAQASFDVLMRYSKHSAATKAFESVKLTTPHTAVFDLKDPVKWREMVTKNRATLEADWQTLAPQRAWLDEVAAFDRLGDLTLPRLDADIIAFRPFRTLSQRTCAIATLQAIDGKGDEAIATLLPLLQVARRMQPSSRTLVRSMVAIVMERLALETATIVMDLTPVSAGSRAKIHATLTEDNPGLMARRLLLMEYAVFAPAFLQLGFGDLQLGGTSLPHRTLRPVLNQLSRLLLLPNATLNLYGQRVHALAALAEKRSLGEFAVASKGFDDSLRRQPGMRNIGGRLLLNMAVPAYNKVMEAHWKLADLRATVRNRVAA